MLSPRMLPPVQTSPFGSSAISVPPPTVGKLVAVQLPVEGLYRLSPANTSPFCRRTAASLLTLPVILPVAVQAPVAGLYNSALDKAPLLKPPAASTSPLESSVRANDSRPMVMLPVVVQVPVAG